MLTKNFKVKNLQMHITFFKVKTYLKHTRAKVSKTVEIILFMSQEFDFDRLLKYYETGQFE